MYEEYGDYPLKSIAWWEEQDENYIPSDEVEGFEWEFLEEREG